MEKNDVVYLFNTVNHQWWKDGGYTDDQSEAKLYPREQAEAIIRDKLDVHQIFELEDPPRCSWDEYFLGIAEMVSTRATCDRLHVGCVFVIDRVIKATGYNGSTCGLEHCDDVGHMIRDNHCVRTVHAEVNAICNAAKHGVAIKGATSYQNWFPCWECFKKMVNAGIKRIVFRDWYRGEMSDATQEVMREAKKIGIEFIHIPKEEK